MEDPVSIAKYGVVEGKYIDTKITDSRQARETALQLLNAKSMPAGYGALETTEPGLRAGIFVKVDMPHIGGTGTYEITEVEKKTDKTVIKRTVTLNKADDPESRIAARLKDYAQRLANLELKDLDDDTTLMDMKTLTEAMTATDIVEIRRDFRERPEDTLALIEIVIASPTSGQEDTTTTTDSCRGAIPKGNNSFGAAKFGADVFSQGFNI